MAERRLEVKILGDSRSLERAFGRSRKSASGLNKSLGGLARVGKVIVGGFILSKAVKGIKDTIDAASDLNESVSKTGVIFGKSAGQVVKFADKASQSLGLSKTAALDASSTFATFGKSAGLSGKELTGFSTQLVTLSADLASFYNTSPEAAITAIGSALRGEAEPIRKYGVLLDAASLQQEALRQGLVKTTKQALTPQQKVLAAQALILAQTTDAQGDFARTSDGAANQQRILAAEVENAQASIGEGLLPAMAAILPLINRVIRAVVPAFAQGAKAVGEFVSEVVRSDQFQGVLSNLGRIASAAFEFIGNAVRAVLPVVGLLAAALAGVLAALTPLVSAVASSEVGIIALTAAFGGFLALEAATAVHGIAASFMRLAGATGVASGVRGLGQALAIMATGAGRASAQTLGLAPGLTAAAGGVSRFSAAASVGKTALSALTGGIRALISGNPFAFAAVGVGVLAGAVVGVASQMFGGKSAAERYRDAMRDVGDASRDAAEGLGGLVDAILTSGQAQDQTREALQRRIDAQRVVSDLERQGMKGTDAYAQATRDLNTANRDYALSLKNRTDAEGNVKTKQDETRTSLANLVSGLNSANFANAGQAASLRLAAGASAEGKARYDEFLASTARKIMGSEQLDTFRGKAREMANVLRAEGTPEAEALARALDGAAKTRDPQALAQFLGRIVTLTGGTKTDVETLTGEMNAAFGKVGETKPSRTFFSTLETWTENAMSGLERLARRVTQAAVAKSEEGGEQVGNSLAAGVRRSSDRVAVSLAGVVRRAIRSARGNLVTLGSSLGGMLGTARTAGSSGRLAQLQASLAADQAARQDAQLVGTLQNAQAEETAAANALATMQAGTEEYIEAEQAKKDATQARIDAEVALSDFRRQREIENLAADIETRKASYQTDVDNLTAAFAQGQITAEDFRAQLNALLGGETGAAMGGAFAMQFAQAIEGVWAQLDAIASVSGYQGVAGGSGFGDIVRPREEWAKAVANVTASLENTWLRTHKDGNVNSKAARKWIAGKLTAWKKKNAKKYGVTLASGGILTRPILAGEAGAEAVIPLTGTRGRDYMARVMEQVARRGGGAGAVVVNVNGNEFSAEEFARKIGPELRRQIAFSGSY